MTLRPRAPRPAVLTAALALALVGCAGGSGGADTAGLPTAADTDDADGADQPLEEQEGPATSAMCAEEEPDCQDTIVAGEGDAGAGGAAGSCLAGDEDCTDESYGGSDVARPIPLSATPSEAEHIDPGATSGATGRYVTAAHLVDDTTLELTFEGGACDLLEDVVVEESPGEGGEVRVLVLSGMDASVDVCTQQIVQWSTTVEVQAPLGDRQLLDLAG